jgi:hypothetical protein
MKAITLAQVQYLGLTRLDLDQLLHDLAELIDKHLTPEASNVVGVSVALNPDPGCGRADRVVLRLALRKPEPGSANRYGLKSTNKWDIVTEVVGEPRPAIYAEAADGVPDTRFRQQIRPVPGGVSVGPLGGDTGTIGCQVMAGNDTYMLSNNHVLAGSDALPLKTAIIQQGAADQGVAADKVAELAHFVPLGKDGDSAPVDAAIALYHRDKDLYSAEIITDAGRIALSGQGQAPTLGMAVAKSGRTTGVTTGQVHTIGGTLKLNYAKPGAAPRMITIENTFSINSSVRGTPFGAGGDSGSLITHAVGPQHVPVGMLFATDDVGGAYANDIGAVLASLKQVIKDQPDVTILEHVTILERAPA